MIRKHLAPGETLPDPPAPMPAIEIPRVELSETAPLLSLIGEPVASPRPAAVRGAGPVLRLRALPRRRPRGEGREARDNGAADFAVVMQGGRRLAAIDRHEGQTSATVTLTADEPLDILVLNDGRINSGPKLYEDRKGMTEKVTLDGAVLDGWNMYRLPCDDLSGLRFSSAPPRGPSFCRGRFDLAATGDTYIDTRGWTKGNVWVNGRNLGRHWKIGPQQTLFCPGVWLRKGTNEIVVLDLYDGSPTRSVVGVTNPIWETHW